MKGRIFDPKVGRFLTTDPLVTAPLSGQSWNPYSYVWNNPLSYVDPTGFEPTVVMHCCQEINDANGFPLGMRQWYEVVDSEPQDQANREAIQTGSSPPPVDVGTTGKSSGYVPPPVTTAPTDWTPNPSSWSEHPVVQIEGGFVGGLALGSVPIAGPVVSLAAGATIGPGTREARIGKAIGEMVGGLFLTLGGITGELIGTGLTTTGIGALLGVPAMAVSAGLVTSGMGSMALGAWELADALMSKGSGSGGSGSTGSSGRVSGAELAEKRAEFNRMKPEIWKQEAATNPGKYSQENLERMRQGGALKDSNGVSMEIHHKIPLASGGTNEPSNFSIMTKDQHRLGPNFKANHPDLPRRP